MANLQLLYKKYIAERHLETLTEQEFHNLVLIFPAILVMQADGTVDSTEMIHLNKLAEENGNSMEMKLEVKFLIRNYKTWKKDFLIVLKEIVQRENCGLLIVQMMIEAAGVSTGSIKNNILFGSHSSKQSLPMNLLGAFLSPDPDKHFFSPDEKEVIFSVASELGVTQDVEVADKLRELLDL